MEETKKKGLNTSSNSYTIIYSVVIVVIVAFLLAFVSSTLKPQQDENVALDKKKQILAALNIRDIDGTEATETYNKVITADMIIDRNGATIEKGAQGGTEAGFLCNSASMKEVCMQRGRRDKVRHPRIWYGPLGRHQRLHRRKR